MTGFSNVMAAMVPLPLSASVLPVAAIKNGNNSPLTTNLVTVTAVGGVTPISYAWAYVSGDATISCNSFSTPTTSWGTNINPSTEKTAQWQCTVTDSKPGAPGVVVLGVAIDILRF